MGVVLSPVQAGDGAVTVGDAHLLFTAEFSRVGDDLLLTGSDGTAQIISGYFTLEVPPSLLSPDGAMMSADLVAMLVGPRAPGLQYAQAGGAPVADAIGQVETLTGSAQVIRAGVAVDLAVGDSVFQGDIVQTGAGSTLGITFIDETIFSLSGGARMALTSMVYDPGGSANSMLFDLVQGTFVFITGKVAPTGEMRFETPVATIGIRGTVPICKIAAIDGATACSIGEDPSGGYGSYQIFDKLTGALLTTVADPTDLFRIQSAGGPLFQTVKTPGDLAIDQALVTRAHSTYGRAQQRLGEEQRGETEDSEFQQATDEPNAGADTDPFGAPPIETAAPPITGPVTSGGLGVDEPEFGEERPTDTNISSSQTQVTQTTSPPPSDSSSSVPPPRQAPNENGGSGPPPAAINNPPQAVADGAVTDEATPVVIAVLGNDQDPDGNALQITSVTQGANGSVVVNPDGTLTYTPDPGFSGTDSFTYTISDGLGGSATTTVSVDVGLGNSPPAAAGDEAATAEDTPVTISVLDNDRDPDGNALSVSAVTQGTNGSVVINPDGTLTYTPNANFNGPDSFTYTISDGQGEFDTATVNVIVDPVNDPPVAADDEGSTAEDTSVTFSVLDNDSDPDGDTLSVSAVTQGANGNVSINSDGTITYTPNAEFSGTDSFTYTISDGQGESDTATVNVTVNPVNDPPVAADDKATTGEDTPVTISVLNNDGDPDGDALSITAVTQGANGSVAINPDGTVTYTPNANFNGADSFTYTVTDGNGGNTTATVDVTVGAVNDPPVAVDDAAATDEDTPVTISVLGNDSDPDGDALSVSAVTQGTNGSVAINENGTVTYTPTANFNGADSFTYTVTDGNGGNTTATVDVTVGAVNDPPVLDLNGASGASFSEGAAPIVVDNNILVSDTDSPNLVGATASIDAIANAGLEILAADTSGTNITASYDAQTGILTLSGTDTVANYQQVLRSVTYENLAQDPTIGGSRTQRNIRFTVNDGAATSAAVIAAIALLAVNNPPVLELPTVQNVAPGDGLVFSVAADDPDATTLRVTLSVDNGALSLAQTAGLTFQAGDGTGDATMTFAGTLAAVNAALAGMTYQADPGFSGKDSVTVTVDDQGQTGSPGALSSSGSVDIVVANVTGDVLVSGSTLIVGDAAVGSLTVDGGMSMSVLSVLVGNQSTGDGTVLVDGIGSSLSVGAADAVDQSFTVGGLAGGTGRLTVSGGATVNAFWLQAGASDGPFNLFDDPSIAPGSGSDGTITITGPGTTLTLSNALGHFSDPFQFEGGFLRFGRQDGDIGHLTVSAGAQVKITAGAAETAPGLQIARNPGSVGTAVIENAGTVVEISQTGPAGPPLFGPFIQVGRSGDGHLTIRDNAEVRLTGEDSFVQVSRGNTDELGPGDTPSVLPQSRLEILSGGSLRLDGTVGFAGMNIGQETNGNGAVLVRGDGSLLSILGLGSNITVARDGVGSLTIDQGGKLTDLTFINIGFNAGSNGTLVLDGTNDPAGARSEILLSGVDANNESGFVSVGRGGTGALSILGGARLAIDGGVGDFPGFNIGGSLFGPFGGDGTITVDGAGSLLEVTGNNPQTRIGRNGPGTLTVRNGGGVSFVGPDVDVVVGFEDGGVGRLDILSGSTFSMDGLAQTAFMVIGRDAGSVGTVNVNNSLLSMTSTSSGPSALDGAFLNVGRTGTGTLNVTNGGKILIDGQMGLQPGFQAGRNAGGDGTILVSGPGSSITVASLLADFNAGYIAIGRSGTGRLEILDGGTVTNAATGTTIIGGDLPSPTAGVGNVLVEGTSASILSTLNAGGKLVIGMQIDGTTGVPIMGAASGTGTLTIGEFGTVNVLEAYIGQNGRVEGTGNFNAEVIILDGGIAASGFSAGTMHLGGNFTLAAGTLEMELGGTAAGLSDLIAVAGQADVQGGLVDFTLIDGYLPTAGDSIDFLTAGEGLTGSPENLSSAVHGVTADFDYQLDFSFGAASFTALSAAQVGTSTIYHGGALDDVYVGGDGDDVLRGGAGADTLTGGAGRDLFILAPGEGGSSLAAADVLIDFEDGVDLIGLAGGVQFSDLSIGASGAGGSTISVAATGEVLAFVEGVAPSFLDTDDFTVVM